LLYLLVVGYYYTVVIMASNLLKVSTSVTANLNDYSIALVSLILAINYCNTLQSKYRIQSVSFTRYYCRLCIAMHSIAKYNYNMPIKISHVRIFSTVLLMLYTISFLVSVSFLVYAHSLILFQNTYIRTIKRACNHTYMHICTCINYIHTYVRVWVLYICICYVHTVTWKIFKMKKFSWVPLTHEN